MTIAETTVGFIHTLRKPPAVQAFRAASHNLPSPIRIRKRLDSPRSPHHHQHFGSLLIIEIAHQRLCLYALFAGVALALQSCARADGNDDAELLTPLAEGPSDAAPCEWPRPREAADSIRLTEQAFDCLIEILPPSVTLAAKDSDSSAPGHRAVRLKGGRYVTEVGHASPHRLLLWDSTGALLTTYDRTGDGPGELTDRSGAYFLLTNPAGDTLYVVDGNNRWSVFTPDLEFVRSFQAKTVRSREGLAVTDNGLILSTAPASSRSRIQVFGLDGTLIREIGKRAPADSLRYDSEGETIAYAGGGLVWTTRPPGLPGDLVLEQWTTGGVLKRTIRRPTPGILPSGFRLEMGRQGRDAHPGSGSCDSRGIRGVGAPRGRLIAGHLELGLRGSEKSLGQPLTPSLDPTIIVGSPGTEALSKGRRQDRRNPFRRRKLGRKKLRARS